MVTTGKRKKIRCAEIQGNWRIPTIPFTPTNTSRNNIWNLKNVSNKIEYMIKDSNPRLF